MQRGFGTLGDSRRLKTFVMMFVALFVFKIVLYVCSIGPKTELLENSKREESSLQDGNGYTGSSANYFNLPSNNSSPVPSTKAAETLKKILVESLSMNLSRTMIKDVDMVHNGADTVLKDGDMVHVVRLSKALHITARATSELCERRLPNAMLVGFPRCGTKTFMHFINVHPDVASASGGISYFTTNYDKDLTWYRNKMPCSFSNQVTMEKSPTCCTSTDAPRRIFAFDPEMKFIFIVRDPVWRIVSRFSKTYHLLTAGFLLKEQAISQTFLPNGSIDSSHIWIRTSSYYSNIKRFLVYFRLTQIHVVDGDKLITNPVEELQKVETFLNIRPYIKPEHFMYNSSKGVYCLKSEYKSYCAPEGVGVERHNVDDGILEHLYTYFQQENNRLFNFLGHSFDWTLGKH